MCKRLKKTKRKNLTVNDNLQDIYKVVAINIYFFPLFIIYFCIILYLFVYYPSKSLIIAQCLLLKVQDHCAVHFKHHFRMSFKYLELFVFLDPNHLHFTLMYLKIR